MRGARQLFPHRLEAESLHLAQKLRSLSLVADGGFEPSELCGTQSDSNGFSFDTARPLITRSTLTGYPPWQALNPIDPKASPPGAP